MACMSENQKRQMEEARKQAIENTFNVCADGQKHKANEYDEYANQINNE